MAGSGDGKGSTAKVLGLVGLVVSVLAGGLGLLFTVAPGLKPCIGATEAQFTGAPVFPRVRYHEHLERIGVPGDEIADEPNLLGAEVRYSYSTSTLRGHRLTIRWSLVRIERDGTIGPVDKTQDRAIAQSVTPKDCDTVRGQDLFVQIPEPRRDYRVVLELYEGDEDSHDRLALIETPVFRG